MVRRLLLSLAFFWLALAAASCTRAPARDPAVTQDALAYVAKIKEWEAVEGQVLKAMQDVRRNQFVDDDYVIATLGEVMDDIELHLEGIERYQPRTPAVGEVHTRYRQAWRDVHEAFTTIITAMQRKDYVQLSRGTDAMGRSRGELVTVAAALNLLLKETGLKDSTDAGTAS